MIVVFTANLDSLPEMRLSRDPEPNKLERGFNHVPKTL